MPRGIDRLASDGSQNMLAKRTEEVSPVRDELDKWFEESYPEGNYSKGHYMTILEIANTILDEYVTEADGTTVNSLADYIDIIRQRDAKSMDKLRETYSYNPAISKLLRRENALNQIYYSIANTSEYKQDIPKNTTESLTITAGHVTRKGDDEEKKTNEDRLLICSEMDLCAVFDGMGGTVNGGAAADVASQAVKEAYKKLQKATMTPEYAKEAMKSVLDATRAAVINFNKDESVAGDVVGTIVTINKDPDGKYFLTVGSVGDTQVLVWNSKKQYIASLVPDQSVINAVSNSFGSAHKPGYKERYANSELGRYAQLRPSSKFLYECGPVEQAEVLAKYCDDYIDTYYLDDLFKDGYDTNILLCSDGVTGDRSDQKLNPDDWRKIFSGKNPQDIAKRAINGSKKPYDDATAIVLNIS